MCGLWRPVKSSCDLTLPPSFHSPEWAANQKNVSLVAGSGDTAHKSGWNPPNPNITIYIRLVTRPSREIPGQMAAYLGPVFPRRSTWTPKTPMSPSGRAAHAPGLVTPCLPHPRTPARAMRIAHTAIGFVFSTGPQSTPGTKSPPTVTPAIKPAARRPSPLAIGRTCTNQSKPRITRITRINSQ